MDAVDECSQRTELLDVLIEIPEQYESNLNFLLTSREEADIAVALTGIEPSRRRKTCIEGPLSTSDIQLYVHEQLKHDRILGKRSSKEKHEIETTLVDGANLMFV